MGSLVSGGTPMYKCSLYAVHAMQ